MTQTTTQIIDEVTAGAKVVAPLLPPNIGIAVSVAAALMNAVLQAQNGGADITDEQLVALFAQDDAAKVADLAAQKAVGG